MDYKLDKEAFVANNTGTSIFNVLLVSSVGWVSGGRRSQSSRARWKSHLRLLKADSSSL